jgi:hypothetical protein
MMRKRFNTTGFRQTPNSSIPRGILLPFFQQVKRFSSLSLCNSKARPCKSLALFLDGQYVLILNRSNFYPPLER